MKFRWHSASFLSGLSGNNTIQLNPLERLPRVANVNLLSQIQMKKRIIIIVILVIAGIFGYQFYKHRKAERSGVFEQLYGNVDIREVSLGFRVGGRLESILFDEGEAVTKDQVLAKLDATPLENQLAEAEAVVAGKRARLAELKNGFRVEEIQQAEAALEMAVSQSKLADLNYQRQQMLDKNEVGTRQVLDATRTEAEVAKASVEAAKAKLALLKAGYREEQISQVSAELQASLARVDQLKTSIEDCVLKAPSNGVIRSRVQETGAIVGVGSPVFVLSIDENPWVRAYVSESNLGRIQPGMPVQLFTDSRPDKPYKGHVGFISPVAEFTPKSVQTEKLRTDLVYRFRVIVEDPDAQLRQGQPVTLKF